MQKNYLKQEKTIFHITQINYYEIIVESSLLLTSNIKKVYYFKQR